MHPSPEVDLRIGLDLGLKRAHLSNRGRLRWPWSAEVVLRRILRRLGSRLIGLPGDRTHGIDRQGRAGRWSRVRRVMARWRESLCCRAEADQEQRRKDFAWHVGPPDRGP